ncbi:MAG TPA: protein kinase [Rudaea sp.]|jgi:serine/threonine protein kinase/Flp pilus assembly protein TadD|uniref:protein kinase domain-containing protein n=1 Tax=Rudaea sp. TaxID=2136325 RepID=UPI002F95D8C3
MSTLVSEGLVSIQVDSEASTLVQVDALRLADLAFGDPGRQASAVASGDSALVSGDTFNLGLDDPLQRRRLGDYELLELIGEGGMGVVYRARQLSLDREVAVKVLSAGPWASKDFIERFHQEAQNAARLQHPNIVAIHDVGTDEDLHFFSMHLVRGRTLADTLRREGKLPALQAAALLIPIARAIDYAHSLGVLHLDLKPANVLVDADGVPHVADFGLARRLERELALSNVEISGTPSYMAPEQATSGAQKITAATDVWGLGAILYELVTGQPPFLGQTARGTLDLVLDGARRSVRDHVPTLPRDLEAIIDQCMVRDVSRRYATAGALANDLEAFVEGRPVAARPLNPLQRIEHWVRREPKFAVAALLIVGLAGIVATTQQWRRTAIPAKSIAVLPLANESGDASQQYFSDGLSEDLITALSQFAGLKVIDRNSSFQFRDSKESSANIGTKLGVASLLEGSVRRVGDVIRVNATLVKAADGTTLWSERYDRPYKDLFALQDDITKAVAGALQAKLLQTGSGGAAIQNTRPPSGNLDAYNAWLQGNFYAARRGGEDDLRRTIDEYDRAIKLDPRYAQAYADRSYAQTDFAGSYLANAAAADTYAHAHEDAERALSLAPDLAGAHRALGFVLQSGDLNTAGAEAEFRKAVALAPDSSDAKTSLGLAQAARGRLEEGIGQIHQAVQLDPLNGRAHRALGDIELALGRLDAAEQAIRRAVELRPDVATNRRSLIYVDIRRGDQATAMRDAQQEPSELYRTVETAFVLQIGSDHAAADAALKAFITQMPDLSAFQIAEMYALRKDPDQAFAWLDHAWSVRDPGVTELLWDPFLLAYKDDPRFAAFCKKVGLPVPADATGKTRL